LFPRFVNGQTGGGNFYLSTLTVIPWITTSPAIDCTLRTFGSPLTVSGVGTSDTFSFTVPANGGWYYLFTSPFAAPTLQAGYATLTCTNYVYANFDYSYYEGSRKAGGATVFSTPTAPSARFVVDQSESSARLALAIANNTDLSRTYTMTVRNTSGNLVGTTQIIIPPRQSTARYIDELVGGTTGILCQVTLQSNDGSDFAVIGLRFVGAVFTTVPPAN
jgi:hypothetical protein